MKSRILNVVLLSVLCFVAITFSNAQITCGEILTVKGNHSEITNSDVNNVEEELFERIERGDLLSPSGASAYDTYLIYDENYPEDHSLKRKLKRSLIAALINASDNALLSYFDEGGSFLLTYSGESIDQHCFVAANLVGEGDFLYENLLSKGYFLQALKFRYVENKESEFVKTELEKAKVLDPAAAYIYNELGLLYFEAENYSGAYENFDYAIQLNPYWEMPQEKLKLAEEALILSKKND